MNQSEFSKQVAAFHKLHGPECYNEGTVVYYRTGAYRETTPPGVLAPPPSGETMDSEYELALLKLKFFRLKLDAAVASFDQLNTFLAHSNPIEPEAELLRLKARKKGVDYARELYRKAEAALANTRRGRAEADYQKTKDAERAAFDSFQHKRQSIRI